MCQPVRPTPVHPSAGWLDTRNTSKQGERGCLLNVSLSRSPNHLLISYLALKVVECVIHWKINTPHGAPR